MARVCQQARLPRGAGPSTLLGRRAVGLGRDAGLVTVLAMALTACGSNAADREPADTVFPITVTRSGGVAGIHEKAVIASDGGVDLTTKDGRRQCTLDPMVLTALRHAAKAITGNASASAAHPDDLVFIVTTGRGSARVEDPALTAVSGEVSRLLDPKQAASVCR